MRRRETSPRPSGRGGSAEPSRRAIAPRLPRRRDDERREQRHAGVREVARELPRARRPAPWRRPAPPSGSRCRRDAGPQQDRGRDRRGARGHRPHDAKAKSFQSALERARKRAAREAAKERSRRERNARRRFRRQHPGLWADLKHAVPNCAPRSSSSPPPTEPEQQPSGPGRLKRASTARSRNSQLPRKCSVVCSSPAADNRGDLDVRLERAPRGLTRSRSSACTYRAASSAYRSRSNSRL